MSHKRFLIQTSLRCNTMVLFALLIGVLVQSCTKSKKELVIANGCDWKLKKAYVNDKLVELPKYKIINLVFHENGTYSYSKQINPEAYKHLQNTDNIVDPKYNWKINPSGTSMYISTFGYVKLIKLDSDTLAFQAKNINYYFTNSCR